MLGFNIRNIFIVFSIFACLCANNSLEIQNVDLNAGTFDVYMTNDDEVGGVQLAFTGLDITMHRVGLQKMQVG